MCSLGEDLTLYARRVAASSAWFLTFLVQGRRPLRPRCPPTSPKAASPAGSPARRRWSSRPTAACSSREQGGQLRVIKNNALLPTPFVTLTGRTPSGERGLLGIAFDPNFATNHCVYVYYTATTPTIHNRVSRLTANGDVAVAGSETILLELENLNATNHNGGAIHFGPDGKLYVAVGENADSSNSQTLDNRLGKMLRINADGTIPADNPFYATATGVNRSIWAMGLRNPFTFAFQPLPGRMFINDVGETTWEEINEGVAGANYGWPLTEGPTTDVRLRHAAVRLQPCGVAARSRAARSTTR